MTMSVVEAVWEIVGRCNAFVEESAPWKLAKDPAQAERLDAVLYCVADALRVIGVLVSPVLPVSAAGIAAQLGLGPDQPALERVAGDRLPDGHLLGEGTPLFPRLE